VHLFYLKIKPSKLAINLSEIYVACWVIFFNKNLMLIFLTFKTKGIKMQELNMSEIETVNGASCMDFFVGYYGGLGGFLGGFGGGAGMVIGATLGAGMGSKVGEVLCPLF